MSLDCCHEPNMLSCDQFLQHQRLLGSGYQFLVGFEGVIQSGFNLIVGSTNAEVELGLLNPYAKTLLGADPERTSSLLRDATLALEQHISSKSGQSLNDYLFTRNLKVGSSFATLSANLGAPIDEINIQ